MIAAGTRYAMGTLLRVEAEAAVAGAAARARDLIFVEIQRLEALLSRFRPDSDVSRINRAAGASPVRVAPETSAAIAAALDFASASDGAFSPAVDGDHRAVRLDPAAGTVFLPVPGTSLDLGGIGKGFALDAAMVRARELAALERVLIDFGGQLLFWTRDERPGPVKVAIENPDGSGAFLGEFEVRRNCSVSTSSQAERPGHLIDRRAAGRVASGAASATVVAPMAVEAEAWSTALFVAGREGLARLTGRPDVEAFLFPG
ncbi:MAG: FAD:protein FMN transferase [Elusimicrobiota bacterium]